MLALLLLVRQRRVIFFKYWMVGGFISALPPSLSLLRFMVGDLSDSEGDLSSESLVKDEEFQGTEETHRAFSHGTELIPWYETQPVSVHARAHTKHVHASMAYRVSPLQVRVVTATGHSPVPAARGNGHPLRPGQPPKRSLPAATAARQHHTHLG